jgi:CubicO group peptidase (beta-lactamase class C family)
MKSQKYFAGVILVIFVLMLVSFAKPAQAAGSVSYEDINAYLEKQLARLNVPGASWVIVEGDQIVYSNHFGTSGPDGGAPTLQTPYFIGSLTKSVTALAVIQLVEEGAVELDAPVQQYLPWFTMADAEAAAQITVRDLLVQTSGISQLPGMNGLANFDDTPGGTERQARALAGEELIHTVGT